MGRYLVDMKNNVIDVTPTTPLRINNFMLLPKMGILFFRRNPKVKNSELNDLKKTI